MDKVRDKIVAFLKKHPKSSYEDLIKLTGLDKGRVRYHVQTLVKEKKAKAEGHTNSRRYSAC